MNHLHIYTSYGWHTGLHTDSKAGMELLEHLSQMGTIIRSADSHGVRYHCDVDRLPYLAFKLISFARFGAIKHDKDSHDLASDYLKQVWTHSREKSAPISMEAFRTALHSDDHFDEQTGELELGLIKALNLWN